MPWSRPRGDSRALVVVSSPLDRQDLLGGTVRPRAFFIEPL